MFDWKQDPHRRWNALTGEWVLVSPHRTARPWQGQLEPRAAPAQPEFDPECYLCPGNARAGGARNPHYAHTFVFDNDFAALRPSTPAERFDRGGLLIAESEPGLYRQTEITGDGFKVFELTSLLPKTGFQVHVAKMAD